MRFQHEPFHRIEKLKLKIERNGINTARLFRKITQRPTD